ncbi:MAG TPA: potassium-transporting ATPase subunit C [Acidimicrobiales bacterium]|jgi:K+-transporting ATPase ATPase C chain
MLTQLRRSVVLCLVALVVFGLGYPLLGVGLSQLFFRHQADGSITVNGSTSIGQNWSDTKCPGHPLGSCVFQGRPDDLGPYSDANAKTPSPVGHPGDDPLVANGVAGGSGATNLGPRSAELESYTKILIAYWHHRGVDPTSDLVTTSGSGVDPDITPADALAEIPMVSRATGLSDPVLRHLISRQTRGAELGFLGSPYLNVLELNEALVKLQK